MLCQLKRGICVLLFMANFYSSIFAQEVASGFAMPVGYPTGTNWSLNGGWGYLEYESSGSVYHPGEDLNYYTGGDTDCDMLVYAAANGIVTESADFGDGWGNIIEIKSTLSNGSSVWLIYAHLNERVVQQGKVVRQGDKIGTVGDANGEYNCHLHFEVRQVDLPASFWPKSYTKEQVEAYYEHPTNFIHSHYSTEQCTTTSTYYPVPLAYVSASGNDFAVSTWWQEDSASALIPYGSVAELASGAVKTSFSGKFTADSLDDILTSYSANNTRYIVVFSATSDGGFNAAKEWYRGSEDSIDKILVGDKDNNNNISNINNVLLQLCTKK